MYKDQAEHKSNNRESGYGEVGECTITPLVDYDGYYIDLRGNDGRWCGNSETDSTTADVSQGETTEYRTIVEKIYVGYDKTWNPDIEMSVKNFEFKIGSGELHLR
jgi:hypothetical protein